MTTGRINQGASFSIARKLVARPAHGYSPLSLFSVTEEERAFYESKRCVATRTARSRSSPLSDYLFPETERALEMCRKPPAQRAGRRHSLGFLEKIYFSFSRSISLFQSFTIFVSIAQDGRDTRRSEASPGVRRISLQRIRRATTLSWLSELTRNPQRSYIP